jgi:C-terminal processing protease CtpA/Prc
VQEPLRKFYGPRYWEGISSEGSYANDPTVVGIIIDLRGNGGGSTADLVPFMGSLTQSSTLVGYTRVKDGFGRLDYSPWSKFMVGTPRLHMNTEKPIVVLADINSISCAELATMLIKNLPNGTFIGERTYGAVGALWPDSEHQHDYFYSGCFGDYDYYQYGSGIYRYKEIYPYYVYTSTYHMVDCNYDDIEGVGVQPDIEVKFNGGTLMTGGKDLQLNRAVDYLRKVCIWDQNK